MMQFLAILKDSFREAVDGFVIYLMIALSALIIIIVGSMSYTPSAPPEAMDSIVKKFNLVFPDKSRSRVFTGSSDTYLTSNVESKGSGYQMRLEVKARATGGTITDDKGTRPILDQGDSFRQTVASWSKPANKLGEAEIDGAKGKNDNKQKGGGRKVEFGTQNATTDEQLAVTDGQMEEFLKSQFGVHAGMESTISRIKTGVEEPSYAFEVTTSGGSSVRGWPHTVKIFFGAVTISRDAPLGAVLWVIEDQIINGLGSAIALLISMIITSFFIPNMLRKGSIDLLVSKPIGRSQLLIYKYVGGLTFIFILSTISIGGVWLAIALRSGHWDPSFLIVIPVLTFTFAILYAVSTLVAVFTKSPIAAMLISVGFAVFLYIVGQVKTIFDRLKVEASDNIPEWAFTLVDTINNVLPRYKDLDKLTSKLIGEGTLTAGESRMFGIAQMDYPSWTGTFGVSLIFIAIMLALSCWRFSKRDY